MDEIIKAQERSYKLWEQHISNSMLLYPNEYLTRYIYANKRDFNSILDFGCGDGRHLEMIARAGIKDIIGVDYNSTAIEVAKNRCQKYSIKLYQNNQNSNLKDLIQRDNLDCVVCWGITLTNAYYMTSEIFKQFTKILKPNGKVIANWRAQDDSLYGDGKEIAKDTFVIQRDSHKGLLYYIPNLDDIKEIYRGANLEIISIDSERFTTDNGKIINSWHIIEAKKI
ncbi:class I SAM-dependent methyltransferase [Campylobacter lanienae]|uniref:class I SAM-dependent methyltransferase n=1 Tax=Campylobacter lanienae TaxID=75658 RepID=UPI002432C17E|nr:class I SAM-dependent methyltransferase [Campylobacter lanienae]MDD7513693.1 class I SAM-dependent methyltransferase [Campylobacter lanienae]MDY5519657.1 class I SAM-dependent methyltransferase [Campylobacter lanienae]